MLEIISYVLVGVLAGISAGLLGISGGLISIPFFMLIFRHFGIPNHVLSQMALGTSLAAMTLNSFSSMLSHHRRKGVVWRIILIMLPSLVIGSVLGAYIAKLLPGKILRILFGCFECLMGIYFFTFAKKERGHKDRSLSPLLIFVIGIAISIISALFGIGGGLIMVPVLYYFVYISLPKSIGTSAASGFFITLVAALSYLYFGMHEVNFHYTVGYIYIPAFILTGVTSLFFAPIGARLAHQLPSKRLKQVFGLGLIFLGALIILG